MESFQAYPVPLETKLEISNTVGTKKLEEILIYFGLKPDVEAVKVGVIFSGIYSGEFKSRSR